MTKREIIIRLNNEISSFRNVNISEFFEEQTKSYMNGCMKGLIYALNLIEELEEENDDDFEDDEDEDEEDDDEDDEDNKFKNGITWSY